MSIADLKTRLHDVPGVETLTMQMLAGGRTIRSPAGSCRWTLALPTPKVEKTAGSDAIMAMRPRSDRTT
jgi:hypothetical protein